MKLADLKNQRILARPEGNGRSVRDGTYVGVIKIAEFIERESKFSEDGFHVMLSSKVEIEDAEGEIIDMFYAVNYSWSKKGNMLKFLEKLDCLPQPGESIRLDQLVGIAVRVTVENVTKDGETYSNIISIRKIEEPRSSSQSQSQSQSQSIQPRKPLIRPVLKKLASQIEAENLFKEAEDLEEDDDLDVELD